MVKLLRSFFSQITLRSGLLLALFALALTAVGAQLPALAPTAYCDDGVCQCVYCDDIVNGGCIVHGVASDPIGCVGRCAYNDAMPHLPGDCSQVPGQGGCGRRIPWCDSGACPARGGNDDDDGVTTATPTATRQPGAPIPITPLPPTSTPRPDPVIPTSCAGLTPGEVREWTRIIPPTISEPIYRPDRPVVIAQDPNKTGFEIRLIFTGGRYEYRTQRLEQWCGPQSAGEAQGRYGVTCTGDVEWHYECPVRCTECYDDPLDSAQIHMRLADPSVDWIQRELAARYPGAQPKEGLPRTWQLEGTRNRMRYEAWWRYAPGYPDSLSNGPIDPGIHGGRIVISTLGTPKSEPQVVQRPFEVPVFLIETTITR